MLEEQHWEYQTSENNRQRFTIGETGKNTLVCIGINPSTAAPGKLDNTMRAVKNRSAALGYDSWIMINIYPQRATNPDTIHKNIHKDIHLENVHVIKKLFKNKTYDVWAAWGTLIEKRPFLTPCFLDIVEVINAQSRWITIGALSKKGHPHHPLYLRNNLPVDLFDINSYCSMLKN
ncbi:MAG: DUF1643 domain-containing protein [Fibrobacterales bacterium]